VRLGGDRGGRATPAARAAGTAALEARAQARAADLAPVIAELREAGVTSLRGLAKALDERGIEAARGGTWTAAGVSRVLARIEQE